MLSGRNDDAMIDRAFQCGVSDYFLKSLQWTLLSERLLHLVSAAKAQAALADSRLQLDRVKDMASGGAGKRSQHARADPSRPAHRACQPHRLPAARRRGAAPAAPARALRGDPAGQRGPLQAPERFPGAEGGRPGAGRGRPAPAACLSQPRPRAGRRRRAGRCGPPPGPHHRAACGRRIRADVPEPAVAVGRREDRRYRLRSSEAAGFLRRPGDAAALFDRHGGVSGARPQHRGACSPRRTSRSASASARAATPP